MAYSPKTWNLSDPITPTDLNRIETGVDEVTALVETLPTWHEIGGSGEPAFTNSWVNYGTGYNTAAFMKDHNGRVFLKGCITSGTMSQSAFTLPAGYRPAQQNVFGVVSNNLFGQVAITSSGTVVPTVGKNAWVSLDGISFPAA